MEEEVKIQYVGFGKRILISIIDIIMFIPIIYVYQFIMKLSLEGRSILPITIYYISLNLYLTFMVTRFGGTPGRLILKAKITNISGEKLSVMQAFLRTITYIPSSIAFIVSVQLVINQLNSAGLQGKEIMEFYSLHKESNIFDFVGSIVVFIDILWILFNKKKRALHDYIAGSYVVYKGKMIDKK
ncbi:RDD family protein [Paenibacillus durus]|uniref:RDD domain-containing protein n=1 Tax=Paenibacillus durus TaxID=44251 RepID=A0A089HQN9_PAEDU|nr:RDD family protein [Paenibacillus durus]AIQ14321.1 hypothetical protein PDUR_22255 [Paenibacillus durus]